MIHEKMYAKDKVKHEIEEVIKEQAMCIKIRLI